MKIAWFIHRYHPVIGGAETYSRAMVRRLVARGHRVEVLTSDAYDLAYFTDRRRLRVDATSDSVVDGAVIRRFRVRHLPWQRYVGKFLSYVPHWPTRCRFASYMPLLPGIELVRGDYDAVFGVGFPFTIFSYAAYRTARAAGAPLILTPFLHLATPGDVVNRAYTRPHQRRLLARSQLIVVPTELEARMIEGWGVPRSRLLHLPMAVEHSDVMGGDGGSFRDRYNIPPDHALVGQLGALDPDKGTSDLVRAVARLNAGRPEGRRVHLVLAGNPTPRFESFVGGLVATGARWLTILGPLPPQEVPDFYAALDVFAMPSRTDSFGIVFLEAWANAKPVVAAAAGGVVEVVRHEQNGLLVPFGDVARLAEALDQLLADRAKAGRLGAAGRDLVTRGYTWDERFATLIRRVHEVIDARTRPTSLRAPHLTETRSPTPNMP
ncbi:MAG: glycosyltransferase family 4 protein [Planctomycetaceae bacterium]|nr:glycosyltransferase family 4 protein [Planctomycetaceae bacterium]